MEKDTRYEIRLPDSLKKAFIEAAKRQDRDGAQLLRDFMRDYVRKNAQANLPGVK